MKGVTSKLKLAKSQRDWQAVSCQICLVVQQLAEALHRLRTVRTSLHSSTTFTMTSWPSLCLPSASHPCKAHALAPKPAANDTTY